MMGNGFSVGGIERHPRDPNPNYQDLEPESCNKADEEGNTEIICCDPTPLFVACDPEASPPALCIDESICPLNGMCPQHQQQGCPGTDGKTIPCPNCGTTSCKCPPISYDDRGWT